MALSEGCVPVEGLGGGDNFDATLIVTVKGSGDGTVTVTSSNLDYDDVFGAIHCSKAGRNCAVTTNLDEHKATTLTLTATPDGSSHLVSWSGECVSVGTPEQSLIEMDLEKDYHCNATFDLVGVTPTCNNPTIIHSEFDTDADWERNEFGSGVSGSNPSSDGNPGGYRLGGLD